MLAEEPAPQDVSPVRGDPVWRERIDGEREFCDRGDRLDSNLLVSGKNGAIGIDEELVRLRGDRIQGMARRQPNSRKKIAAAAGSG